MHSLVLIPNEVGKLKLRVLVSVLNMSKALMLINLIVVSFIILLLLIVLLLLRFNKLTLETFDHAEEIYAVCAEDGELSIINRVELDLLIVLRLAWKLDFRLDSELFVLLDIKYGYAEVGDTANH